MYKLILGVSVCLMLEVIRENVESIVVDARERGNKIESKKNRIVYCINYGVVFARKLIKIGAPRDESLQKDFPP